MGGLKKLTRTTRLACYGAGLIGWGRGRGLEGEGTGNGGGKHENPKRSEDICRDRTPYCWHISQSEEWGMKCISNHSETI
jgi:hypothetical protein